MHLYPAAPQRAGFRVTIAAIFGAIVTGLTCSTPALGQQPGEIIKKMQALYTNASSYQAIIKQTQSGKSPRGNYAYTSTSTLKYRRPNQLLVKVTVTASGALAAANGSSSLIVSDGKTMYRYEAKSKMYAKVPAQPKIPPLVGTVGVALAPFDLASAKVTSSATVGGRSAYVIQASIAQPSAAPPGSAPQKIVIVLTIDKGNFNLLRVGPVTQPSALELSDQVFNAPLSASTFAFTPPPGSKLAPPPSAPMPGGRPAPGGGVAPGAPHR